MWRHWKASSWLHISTCTATSTELFLFDRGCYFMINNVFVWKCPPGCLLWAVTQILIKARIYNTRGKGEDNKYTAIISDIYISSVTAKCANVVDFHLFLNWFSNYSNLVYLDRIMSNYIDDLLNGFLLFFQHTQTVTLNDAYASASTIHKRRKWPLALQDSSTWKLCGLKLVLHVFLLVRRDKGFSVSLHLSVGGNIFFSNP